MGTELDEMNWMISGGQNDFMTFAGKIRKGKKLLDLKVKKMKKKKEISIVRSSAAEYLTFITATGESDVNAIYFDENVWLTQKMMGLLYNVETHTINYHLKKIFADGELDENSVIRKFRITASDGKSYNTNHYNLKAIIAVGNKVESCETR